MKKSILGVLSTLMILGACVGCGNTNQPGNTSDDDRDPGQQAVIPDKYDKDGKLIVSFFGIDLDSLQSQTKDTKLIIDYIENKFNVSFKYLTGSTSSWENVLNQYIGGGDVPDVFFHDHSEPSYSTWLDDKYLFNYSPYLNDYPNLKAAFERFPETEMKAYLGGDYYSYPIVMNSNTDSNRINEHALYYRRDWYNNLVAKKYKPQSGRALVDPEDPSFNYENFYDLVEGYTLGDPDNNGENDTYGYVLTKDGGVYWWYPLFSMFNVIWDGWHFNETTQSYEPDCTSDNMKTALDYIAKMFDNGYINSNYSTTTTQSVMKNEFVNGVAGMMCYNATYPMGKGILDLMMSYTDSTTSLSDVVRAMPVVTNAFGQKTMFGYANSYGYRAINNDLTRHKKKVILSIMDWMLSEEGQRLLNYGIEGTHYRIDGTSGEIVSLLGNDKAGYPKTLYDETVAPGAYRIKGMVSWSTNIPEQMEHRDEQMQLLNAWESQYLVTNPLDYCTVDTSYATTISALEDLIETNFKNIISDTTTDKRNQIWTNFVRKYNTQGSSYITAMNESAKNIFNK